MSYLPTKYKILSIRQKSDDTKLFKLKSLMNPRPGTFIEVSLPRLGEAPLASCTYDDEFLEILTKKAGSLTTEMFKLKQGDNLWIRGPYGKGFPMNELKGKNLILVAGGTGVAPITSMVSYIEKNKKDFKKIFIYFGFRNEEHVLLEEKIKRWQKKFNVHVCLSRETDPNCPYEKGYVNKIMEKHNPKIEETLALLCGPEPMMKSVTLELKKLGLKNNKIYWSLERRMECAFGSCGRCQIQDLYTCKDGPVFRYDVIKPRLDNEEYSNKIK